MNKNTVSKIKFFLMGITSRMEDNRDILISADAIYTSGLKKFRGRGKPSDKGISYNFSGVTKDLGFSEFADEIAESSKDYDSLVLTVTERGTVIELTADDRDVKVKNRDSKEDSEEENTSHGAETSTLLTRKYLINHRHAAPLLKELGILTADGKVKNDKIRKYNQIDHYVEILEKDIQKLKDKKIHIVDCGCGKSYLSFVLNYYVTEVMKLKCHITGIDISPGVIEASRKTAENLGYRNMDFIVGDIKTLKLKERPSLVMSLHACDNATDMALSFGIRNDAGIIVAVPCCHAEMNSKYSYKPFSGILKHGILKRRMSDILTDGIRGLILESEGYEVTMNEYISPLETPKNLMIRAVKTGKRNKSAESEVISLITSLDYAPALYRYINGLED